MSPENLTWRDEKGKEYYFDYELRTRPKESLRERLLKRMYALRDRKSNKTKEPRGND